MMFYEKIMKRIERNREFEISVHGGKTKSKGLNVNGAVAIEEVIEKNENKKNAL